MDNEEYMEKVEKYHMELICGLLPTNRQTLPDDVFEHLTTGYKELFKAIQKWKTR